MLLNRKGVYYFRWQIPADLRAILGRRELFKSLRTKDLLVAESRALPLKLLVNNVNGLRRTYPVDGWNTQVCEAVRKSLLSPASTYKHILLASMGSIDFVENKSVHNSINDYLFGYSRQVDDRVNVSPIKLPEPQVANQKIEEPETLLFSEVYKKFLDYKVNLGLSERIQKEYARFLEDWNELVPDKAITVYRKQELKDFLIKTSQRPKRILKKYRGKSITELLEMDDIPEKDLIRPRTVLGIRKWLQGVFKFAFDEGFIPQSPARYIKLDFLNRSPSYAAYSDSDVRTMLNKALTCKKPWNKWVIWIAAYSGMRRGEIVQLHKDDIRYDKDSGRYYFLVTDEKESQRLKTEAAKRQIPIHPKLIELGILDLRDKSKNSLLPKLKAQRLTTWFSENFKVECGISDFNDLGERQVFHSFRHTVITKMLEANVSIVKTQQIVGHEKQFMGVTSRYTHQFKIKELVDAVESIEYGVELNA